ncbi:heavy-metal-associated domain-containing protein [Peribacillus sp. SCS-155]|uniref:heavy-metal-associated domain-containing protein n=1 Tax=Peribacillus sedimenti TaxID=3115297 RepID=UPI003905CC4C
METGKIRIQDELSLEDADKILQALHGVWGVQRAEVDLENKEARFIYDKLAASLHDFQHALLDTGYHIDEPYKP